MSGKVVRHIDRLERGRICIDRGDLRGGLYFYRLRDASEVLESGKLVVFGD